MLKKLEEIRDNEKPETIKDLNAEIQKEQENPELENVEISRKESLYITGIDNECNN